MRRAITYPLVALGAAASTVAVASPALAHGYVSAPPSRQALCAAGIVADCGQIQFEPQSVEGPKGLKSCNGGVGQFAALNDNSRAWPAKSVGSKVTFTWVFTARHRTSNFEYFIGNTKVATVDGGNAQPDAVVNHSVDLSAFPGRQTVLAVWNIGDTPNAFYSCVDLNVGGGGGSDPSTPSSPPPSTTRPPAPEQPADPPADPPAQPADPPAQPAEPTAAPPATGGSAWAAQVAYKTGDVVTFQGKKFKCRQGHTSLSSWEPSIYTLALWLPL
ncbi:lytic polysaccharide monooxygenase [Actinoplanes sp. NPDC051633]|uniref:lytic polysaccharide monooxygenase n=1 Tax=Actinoplanes sp. NPDC051633 TaxID=3155670 RepID=UPI00343C6E7D